MEVPKPMLASSGNESMLDMPNYWAEEKYDGTRVVVISNGEGVRVFSRAGKEYTDKYPELVKEFLSEFGVWDGELVFCDKTGRVEFFTIGATEETKQSLEWKYVVFDNLAWKDLPYKERRSKLESWFKGANLKKTVLSRLEKGSQVSFWNEIKARKGEGLILKDLDSPYVENARNKTWIKVKYEDTEDLTVIGWTKGLNRRAKWFGSLTAIDNEGRKTEVGGGFTDKMLDKIVGEYLLPEGKVTKRFVVEIKFLNKTKDSYRMPRFLRIRDDKKPLEVSQ